MFVSFRRGEVHGRAEIVVTLFQVGASGYHTLNRLQIAFACGIDQLHNQPRLAFRRKLVVVDADLDQMVFVTNCFAPLAAMAFEKARAWSSMFLLRRENSAQPDRVRDFAAMPDLHRCPWNTLQRKLL
jgi:hypothetical protein